MPEQNSPQRDSLRPVLVISGGHTLQPLWKPLSETYDLCVMHPQSAALAGDMGIPGAFGINKYLNADVQEEATNTAYNLAARVREQSASLVSLVRESFGDGEIPEPLRPEKITAWFPAMVGEHIRQEAVIVNMLEALKNERQISGCVVHEDVTPDARTIVLWCKAKGIPTIHVPHANCLYTGEGYDIHTESISDYIAAAGEYMREWYVKRGYNPDRIRVCGQPQLDSWYGMGGLKPSRKESRDILGIDEKDYLLVYATSWGQLTSARGDFDVEYENSLREVIATTKELGAILCIKMHPGEAQGQEQIYLNVLKESGVTGFVTRQFNEYVLRAADALVSHGPSNICIQAAILGVPTVFIPTEDFEFTIPGPVMSMMSLTHAVRISQMLDRDKNWEIFSRQMNSVHPLGNAAERVTEFVREVCQ